MWERFHVSRESRVFWGSRRGHEDFMHAESAEFAEAHIASLVLAMRDRVSRKSRESIEYFIKLRIHEILVIRGELCFVFKKDFPDLRETPSVLSVLSA